MQLVLVAHRCRAAFEVAHVCVVVGNDERALELTRVACVDAEVGAKLHRAAHALGYVDERSVGEHGAVERCEEVVAVGHHASQVLAHEVGMVLYGVAYRAEDDAFLGEVLREGGLHAHGVHDGVYRHAAECESFFERYSELVECLHQLGIYLLILVLLLCERVGVVRNRLIVDLGHVHVAPLRLLHRLPVAESLQTELKHPVGFALLA